MANFARYQNLLFDFSALKRIANVFADNALALQTTLLYPKILSIVPNPYHKPIGTCESFVVYQTLKLRRLVPEKACRGTKRIYFVI